MPDSLLPFYLTKLPVHMKDEVLRYRNINNQKATLIGKLMLKECLDITNSGFLISHVEKDDNNKPFIPDWNFFNVSHSGDAVVFVSSDTAVGVDVEKIEVLDYIDIMQLMHLDEQNFISQSIAPLEAFYDIWVKKEAVLKAYGVGIINDLHSFSCLNDDVIFHGNKWYFQFLPILSGYRSCVCSLRPENNLSFDFFKL